MGVHLFSTVLPVVVGLDQKTCPVHEHCNGSYQPHGQPVKFETPHYGELPIAFDVDCGTERGTLPLEQASIPLPTDAFQYSAIEPQKQI